MKVFSAAFLVSVLSVSVQANECKMYRVGHDQIIRHSGQVEIAQFSPDGSKVVTASHDGTTKILDLHSGKETTIKHGGSVYSAHFSPDGSKVVTASHDGTAKILDLNSSKETVIQHNDRVNSAQFSPDGSKVVTTSNGIAKILDLHSGKETTVKHSDRVSTAQFSPDGSKVVITSYVIAKILDLHSGKETTINHSKRVTSAQFSPDGSKVVTASDDGTAKILDLHSGKETTVKHSERVNSAQFSPDGSKVVTTSYGIAKILDLHSGKETTIKHSSWVNSAQFSPDGSKVVTVSGDHTSGIFSLSETCAPTHLQLDSSSEPADCVDCGKKSQNSEMTIPSAALIQELQLQTLCLSSLDPSTTPQWRKLIPPSDQFTSPISPKLALQALLKFQKPGGFEPKEDLGLLLAILKSDIMTRHPGLIVRAMQSVLHASNVLYEELTREFPRLLELTDSSETAATCRTKEEDTLLAETAKKHVEYLLKKNGKHSRLSDWPLKPLTPLLAKLPAAQKDSLISDIALRLADAAADTKEFSGIFHSKLYKFAHEAVAPLFGVKAKPLSDLTLVREAHTIRPIILGTQTIIFGVNAHTSRDSGFGFHALTLPEISVDDLSSETPTKQGLRWSQEGKTYTADLKLQLGEKEKTLVPVADAPDYPGLWKDRTLTGMIITGSNLSSHAKGVMDQYLVYYERDGFKFEDTPREVADLPAFLKQMTESGELDYFIKSAHSDGDEKNLFRMDIKAKVFVGKRVLSKEANNSSPLKEKLGDKVTPEREVVYLVFPDPQGKESRLVGNQEFGEWVRTREKKGGQQLIYLNGSCWSKTKAIHEIEAAGTPLFLNIPTTTSTWTFSLNPKNVEGILLTGLRGGLTYDEIRTKMNENEGYKSGKEDQFIFPDEYRYKSEILDLIAKPVIQTLTLTRDGEPYNIEQGE